MSPAQRPHTLMQDRPPPARRNSLATHGRTIHVGQSRPSHAHVGSSVKPQTADIGRSAAKVDRSANRGHDPARIKARSALEVRSANRIKLPRSRDVYQPRLAALYERECGARHQVTHRPGRNDLAYLCKIE